LPASLPALAAAILRSDRLWRVRSHSARFEAADPTPSYALSASLAPQEQAERAARLVTELARKMQRLPDAFASWPLFEPGPYFDLYADQVPGFCRIEETRHSVRVRIYADLLLPAFRRAERYFVEAFLPAYHAALGDASGDIFAIHLSQEAAPELAALLDAAEQAVSATLASLESHLDVLALLGGLEERIQHRPPPGSKLAPGLPLTLQRLPRQMSTLTLDAIFTGPEQRAHGREAWVRFQQAQTMR
jgi:hypothetical protein